MKKKGLITASALTLAFATAAHLEWAGYEMLDRANGTNLLCTIDPACRHLTTGEKKLAQKYFGDTVQYDHVRIFDRAFMGIFGHGRSGMSPNGHIYFAEHHRHSPNFAHEKYADQKYFIHEMVHVAQKQSGLDIPRQAFIELLRHAFNYSRTYHYTMDSALAFDEMNFEQQAQMMEDYFLKRSEFADITTFTGFSGQPYRYRGKGDDWIRGQCAELGLYEIKFRGHYPVGRDELCLPAQPATGLKLKAANYGYGLR